MRFILAALVAAFFLPSPAHAACSGCTTPTTPKTITTPYATPGLQFRTPPVTVADTNTHTVPGSSLSGYYTYITDHECGRSDDGTTVVVARLNDSAGSLVAIPPGAVNNKTYATPLRVGSMGTALNFTPSGGTLTCQFQGFFSVQ